MDEQAQFQAILDELNRRAALDPQLRQIMKKIEKGKANFTDTALLSQRMGNLLGELFGAEVLDIPEDAREAVCEGLLQEQYDSINETLADVQEALDGSLGLHLTPQKAPFPLERVQQLAHSLLDPIVKPETLRRRADKPVATVAKSFHDDYIKTNAKLRSRLGFKCYLNRVAAAGCCKWCTDIAGRYVYGDHPDDIFRRHDNCDCTVTFENGRERQDVWSKRTWQESPAEVLRDAEAPARFSEEDSRDIEMHQLSQIHGLNFSAMPGKDSTAVADMEFIGSDAFASKFKGKYENETVENAVVSACRQIVKNRNGTYYEEAFFIDAHSGETFSYVKSKQKSGVKMPEKLKKRLTNAPENSIIMIHNHPNSSPLSTDDYKTSTKYAALHEVIACGHNGDVYVFRETYGTAGKDVVMLDGTVECESVRDFRMLYSKYLARSYEDYEARHLSWTAVMQNRGFFYEKR